MAFFFLNIGNRRAFFEQIWLFIHVDIQMIIFKLLIYFFFLSFTDVPFPPSNKLITSEVFDPRTNKPRTDVLKQHFIVEGKIFFFITYLMIQEIIFVLFTFVTCIKTINFLLFSLKMIHIEQFSKHIIS